MGCRLCPNKLWHWCNYNVPAHDERDYDFAKKYNIEIKQVISDKSQSKNTDIEAFTDEGYLIN